MTRRKIKLYCLICRRPFTLGNQRKYTCSSPCSSEHIKILRTLRNRTSSTKLKGGKSKK